MSTSTTPPQPIASTAATPEPSTAAGVQQDPPPAEPASAPIVLAPVVDPLLFVHATAHADLEKVRVATSHRLGVLTRTEPDEDGETRGWGLPMSHPDVARIAALLGALEALEHDAEITLARSLRRSPIYPWIKAQPGLGDKQVARLLAAIGDPYWNMSANRRRTVSQLWAYCGLHVIPADRSSSDPHAVSVGGDQTSGPGLSRHAEGGGLTDRAGAAAQAGDRGRTISGDRSPPAAVTAQAGDPDPITDAAVTHRQLNAVGVAARRRRGQQANWSGDAKVRTYLIAVSCIRQRHSPYRAVYDARRARTVVTHPEWTDGHHHIDALRITGKAVLRDLWREARRIHEEENT